MTDANRLRDPDYRPPLGEAVPLDIQHVLAMFAGEKWENEPFWQGTEPAICRERHSALNALLMEAT